MTSFSKVGLGGNINSVAVQFYDPFNYPAVSIYEYAGCSEESTAYGVRSFNVTGTRFKPNVQQGYNSSYPKISYPALNGNSALVPLNA